MKTKRFVTTFLLLLLILNSVGLVFFFFVQKAAAQTSVYVWPTVSVVNPPEVGKTFTIDINVTFVEHVWAWELKLSFDPEVLYTEKGMIADGNFLTQQGAADDPVFVVYTGYVGANNNIKSLSEWVDGEGRLMSITFKVIDTGKSLLHLYETKFVKPDRQPILDQPVPVDGEFYTYTPHASYYYLPSTTAAPDYTVDPTLKREPIVGETITFNASAYTLGGRYRGSYDPDGGTITTYRWDFGDGSPTATGVIVYHSFSQAKSYQVDLTVTDNDQGRTDTHIEYVLVLKHDVSVTSIGVPRTTLTLGKDVKMNVTITNLGLSYEYANATLYYRYGGVDTLIWYNKTEHKSAFSNALEIDPVTRVPPLEFPPGKSIVANYTWITTGLAEGDYTIWANISLTDRSGRKFLKDIYQKELDFNTTNNVLIWGNVTLAFRPDIAITKITLSPTLQLPTVIRYGTPEVSASVTVKNVGFFDVTSINVTLYEGSTPVWSWTNISLVKGETKVLTPPYKWKTESLLIGNYTLTANASRVEVEIGGEILMEEDIDDNTFTLKVAVTLPPVAAFTYSPAKPLERELVTFNATSSHATLGWTIKSYEWRINDTVEPTLTGSTPSPIPFTQKGIYNITLTVTDNIGLINKTFQLIHIYVLPTAGFTYSPTYPKVNQQVTLNASSSYDLDPGGEIVGYSWSFGDGQAGTGIVAIHAYTALGEYPVNLTVTDKDNHQAWLIETIRVVGEPVASFDFSGQLVVDQIVSFNASSSQPIGGNIIEYKWDFGDGSTPMKVTDAVSKHKYAKGGTFIVTLTVTDDEGLNNTTTKSITIAKLTTTLSLTASPANVAVGQTVTIGGQISPTVLGATVMIYYREGNGPWTWLRNTTTAATGRYNYDWVTTTAGTFQLKAQWNGNEKYNGDASDPSNPITVQSAVATVSSDIYFYALGGIVAIIAIAVGARLFLKRRKTTPKA